jgi:hypothetical protein
VLRLAVPQPVLSAGRLLQEEPLERQVPPALAC